MLAFPTLLCVNKTRATSSKTVIRIKAAKIKILRSVKGDKIKNEVPLDDECGLYTYINLKLDIKCYREND